MASSTTPGEEVGSHAGTIDLASNSQDEVPESSRRYGGPMIKQYATTILCYGIIFVLLVVAIALGAQSLQKSNEALELAQTNSEAIESESLAIENEIAKINNDSVNAQSDDTSGQTTTTTPSPTSKPTTNAPTQPHPLNPKWYQTTHSDYQMFVDANEGNEGSHDWHIAQLLCSKQNLALCGYDAYCPTGQGGDAFGGGPPPMHNSESLEETQWSPFWDPNPTKNPADSHWVQIGIMSPEKGGTDDNSFLKCWKYDDWYGGNGVDIVDVWEEKHRMWILCCERVVEEDVDTGGVR